MLGDRSDAEDVAQEAFLRLWRHAPRWRQEGATIDTWLHRVTLNLCYDRLRRRQAASSKPPLEPADAPLLPDAVLSNTARDARVAAAVRDLPERQRDAILLCHYQEVGNIAAAAVMGISVEALESLLARGRRALRARFSAEAGDA